MITLISNIPIIYHHNSFKSDRIQVKYPFIVKDTTFFDFLVSLTHFRNTVPDDIGI